VLQREAQKIRGGKQNEEVYNFTFFFDILLSSNIGNSAPMNRSVFKYSPGDLPSLLIAYNFAVAQYEDFKCLWDLKEKEEYSHPFPLLEAKFKKISPSINISFAFTHTAFVVQNYVKGQFMGFGSQKNKEGRGRTIPFENVLFVTTPIESFGNRCLVFLSSVSPEGTYVLAVDKELGVELLYSTFDDNINRIWENQGYTIMCSIYSVQVMEPGVFMLSEKENNRCTIFREKRRFQVNITSGKFKISLER